jgi:Ricin-type beta-trefoil lectin domain
MTRRLFRRFTWILAIAASFSAVALMPGTAAPANAQTGPPAELHNMQNSYYCLGIAGGRGPGSRAVLWKCNGSKNQMWALGTKYGSGDNTSWQLRNEDGWCLAIAGGSSKNGADFIAWTCKSHAKDSNEYFQPYLNSNGTLAFINYQDVFSKEIGVKGGVMANGSSIVQWPYNGDFNQYWSTLTDL